MKLPETSARNLFGRAPGRKGNMDANAFRNRKIFRFLEVMKIKTKLSGKFEAVKQGKPKVHEAPPIELPHQRKKDRAEAVNDQIIVGDFRAHADKVADKSLSLIFEVDPIL